jgi:hypothetical protein
MRGDDVESIADGSPRLLDVIEHAEPTNLVVDHTGGTPNDIAGQVIVDPLGGWCGRS